MAIPPGAALDGRANQRERNAQRPEAPATEAAGKDAASKEATGKDATGKEATGKAAQDKETEGGAGPGKDAERRNTARPAEPAGASARTPSARCHGWWTRALPAMALATCLMVSAQGRAGTRCEAGVVPPAQVAAAAENALRVVAELDRADAPVALVARVGRDLSEHGLVYSHVGFAVRDHTDGRWSVVHLLNECGSDRSALHVQGLVNFFSDDLVNQDARIVWLQAPVAQRLADRLLAMPTAAMHQPRYSVIARPGSEDYQNSTAWVLEVVAATLAEPTVLTHRTDAHAWARRHGHVPDRIHIAYGKRVLGGLFTVNASFTDHPIGTRLSGDYPVVTVRSILRWLELRQQIHAQHEWRHGRLLAVPGPA